MAQQTTHPKKILIITSSGGGGLLQTANAKEQEAISKYPGVTIVKHDLLKDWVWRPLGELFVGFWNKAQMKGNVSAQKFFLSGQFTADFFLHIPLFFRALYTLFKEDVDHIIDTQPLGTSAIIKALKIYNRKKNKNVRLEKVLVDLPTKKATHFFRPIRKLRPNLRKLLQLTTIKPLLEEGETEEQFWQENCGLSLKDINLEDVYVRTAFRKLAKEPKLTKDASVQISYKSEEELQLIQKCLKRSSIEAKVGENVIDYTLPVNAKIITILLGSQPANGATLNYVKKWTQFAKESPKQAIHLFVFCADHQNGSEDLFKRVADFAARARNFPQNFSVVPFSFQSESAIARLFHRSDITCTRSGGQTAMELMCVSHGQIWIHSEARKGEDLLEGIPGWESASAVYLQKVTNAKIVTPDTILKMAKTTLVCSAPIVPISSLVSSA